MATDDPPHIALLFPAQAMLQFVAVFAFARSTPEAHTH